MGIDGRSLGLAGVGCPSISTEPGQLLPVKGTPQANAAYCTPGRAATRSKQRQGQRGLNHSDSAQQAAFAAPGCAVGPGALEHLNGIEARSAERGEQSR